MVNVAQQYPAHTDSAGVTWWITGSGKQDGWTAQAEYAHESYVPLCGAWDGCPQPVACIAAAMCVDAPDTRQDFGTAVHESIEAMEVLSPTIDPPASSPLAPHSPTASDLLALSRRLGPLVTAITAQPRKEYL